MKRQQINIFLLLFFIGIFPLVLVYPQTEQYKFRHITTMQNLSSNNVFSILQDSRGFLWFGTSVGLCRYDGVNIKSFLNDPSDSTSISGNFIYSNLVEDRNGNLWLGTLGNGLNRYNRSTGTFTRFKYKAIGNRSLSYNKVFAILQDKSENIWAGTDYGLNLLNDSTGTFNHYFPKPDSTQHAANKIHSLFEDSKGTLWVGTGEGVFTFDRKKKIYHFFNPKNQVEEKITNKLIYSIFEDINDNLWFGTSWGLYKYDRINDQLYHFFPVEHNTETLSNISIRHIQGDLKNEGKILWISTSWGLNKLDINSGKAHRIYHDPDDPNSLGSNYINSSYIDENGRLLVATAFNGISYTDLFKNRFNYVHINPLPPDPTGYTATSFLEDYKGNLWVGTREGGLLEYNSQFQLISRYEDDLFDKNDLGFSFIFNLVFESDNNLLIGTRNSGLIRYNLLSSDLANISFFVKDSILIRPIIREVFKDSHEHLWVGTTKGLYFSGKNNTDSLQLVQDSILSTTQIHALCEDKDNGFWVGTVGQGLFYFPAAKSTTLEYVQFKNTPGVKNSLSNDLIACIYEDSQGQLWIGTNNGLNQYVPDDNNFISYFSSENPGVNFIFYIQEDKSGNLWMTTQSGLVRFNPKSTGKEKFRVYTIDDGLPFDNIYPYSFYLSKGGRLFIGGNQESGNGFFWFYPDSLKENTRIPPVAITDFNVHNETLFLDSNINEIKHINLSYRQNYFSFEFSALNFINPDKNQYAYMLDGLDNDWMYSGTRHFVSYSNLKPGDYIFRLKGSNNDGYWNDNGKSISITISPPPWKTWWAYSLYILFFIAVIYSWRRYDLKRLELKQQLKVEHLQTEKLEELDRMKSRFFANISHEFRTPLTLILGPLAKLRSKLVDKESEQDLGMMQRNAHRLQNLINQLLSLSKLESGKMQLKVREENIVPIINGYVQSFESLAKQKNIALSFNSTEDNIPLFIDRDKIGKILLNLLSNAFKFTGEEGKIEVEIITGNGLNISISDTGCGIPPDKLEYIFNRFYQADDSNSRKQEGTGIGLALTKELVELHHGKISVESQPGIGTTFTVFLRLGKDHLRPEEIIDQEEKTEHLQNPLVDLIQPDNVIHDETEKDDSKPLLLIVEDNSDLRSYIRSFLTNDYHILEATDGELGMKKAIDNIPDLVISDVMMPKMDGYEFSRKLKTDERTSHIPIILLTAKAGMENKLEGLETGADDFLTKPFDPDELQVRIQNLIQQRRNLRKQFKKEFDQYHGLQGKVELSMDQKFIHKAKKVVGQYLSDPDFSVEFFGQEMALSRSQLHRKLRALLDQSPIDFIRTIRLNRAAVLLAEKSANVSEIAYDVGFNSPSYFTECFRKQFGKLPSEYTG